VKQLAAQILMMFCLVAWKLAITPFQLDKVKENYN
jgi:hypothetical protein